MACISGRPCYDNIPCEVAPCETRTFDCFGDEKECYETCNKGQKMPFVSLFSVIEITPEIEQAIIDRFNRIPGAKSIEY